MTTPPTIEVIIGSTREERVGAEVGRWFAAAAAELRGGDVSVDLVDLAEFVLPDRYPSVPTRAMAELAGIIGRADAFVIVTPEYNRGYPASLKQAIDCAYDEWHAKPVGFVSYGHRFQGRFAVEQLRGVFVELHAVTMRDTVSFDLADWDPVLGASSPEVKCSLSVMLDQLLWWARALRAARVTTPYVT